MILPPEDSPSEFMPLRLAIDSLSAPMVQFVVDKDFYDDKEIKDAWAFITSHDGWNGPGQGYAFEHQERSTPALENDSDHWIRIRELIRLEGRFEPLTTPFTSLPPTPVSPSRAIVDDIELQTANKVAEGTKVEKVKTKRQNKPKASSQAPTSISTASVTDNSTPVNANATRPNSTWTRFLPMEDAQTIPEFPITPRGPTGIRIDVKTPKSGRKTGRNGAEDVYPSPISMFPSPATGYPPSLTVESSFGPSDPGSKPGSNHRENAFIFREGNGIAPRGRGHGRSKRGRGHGGVRESIGVPKSDS